jgi:hypothetical protein
MREFSCKLSAGSQPVKRINGRQPGNQLVELSVEKSSAWAAVTRGRFCTMLNPLPRNG